MATILHRLVHKFIRAPLGYGRPMSPATADGEYRSGAWSHFHEPLELPRQESVIRFVTQFYPNPSILDLGCGSGRLAQLLQAVPFRRYLGVDFSPEGIRLAHALSLRSCEFVEADFETWRSTEKFDVIIFSECIGYARDPGALVAGFIPSLAPGGMMIVSYFRSGHWQAHWRRIEQRLSPFEAATVVNERNQTWDIKLFRPSSPA